MCACCKPMSFCRWLSRCLKRNSQLIAIMVAIVIGIVLGIIIQRLEPSDETLMWLGYPGELFLRIFKVCIVPLIVFGVVAGTSAMDPKSNGKAGAVIMIYSMGLSVISCVLGFLIVLAIKPGRFKQANEVPQMKPKTNLKTQDIFADLFRNLFTDNFVRATMQKARTDYIEKVKIVDNIDLANTTQNATDNTVTMTRTLVYANTTNLIGILFFCIVFGMAVGRLGKKAVIIHQFASAGTDVMIRILGWFMWCCPIGIASLIISGFARQRDLGAVMARLGLFMATTALGNVLQSLLLYPLIFLLATRKNPLPILLRCGRLTAMAFALCSSILIMPEYYKLCHRRGYDMRLTNMVVPLVTTISSSGSALYVGAATLFVTQYGNITVDAGEMTLMVLLGAFSCFAVPASPSGSIIIVMLVLQSINVPSELAGILFSIDWFLDRIRTTANAVSKAHGAALLNELCQSDLPEEYDTEKKQEQAKEPPETRHLVSDRECSSPV